MASVSVGTITQQKEVVVTEAVEVRTYYLTLTEEEAIDLAAYTGVACPCSNPSEGPQTSGVFNALSRILGNKYRGATPCCQVSNRMSFRAIWRRPTA